RGYADDRSDLVTVSPLAAALAAVARAEDPPFAPPTLVLAGERDELDLAELESFWRHPARAFLTRLGVRLPDDEEPADARDQEPFCLDLRERAALVRTLVGARLAGGGFPALERVAADGVLPPGALAALALGGPEADAEALSTALARAPAGGCSGVVEIAGCRVAVALAPPAAALWVAGRPDRARDHLAAWVRHCARGALGQGGETLLIGRGALVRFAAWSDADAARSAMAELVAGWRASAAGPLPFAPETSAGLAESLAKGLDEDSALAVAERAWQAEPDSRGQAGEGRDRWNLLAWRGSSPFAHEDALDWVRRVWLPLTALRGESEALG
ncbi:MAG: hypothetical protein L6R48_22105, partial [Planctomycetes bacterium]|nr:hypothetical protein [Planctomycetota bacterium]